MQNARARAGVEDGGCCLAAPPAPGFSAGAVPEVSGVLEESVYAAAAVEASSTRSRVRAGSILMPGPMVEVTVIECR